jgi:large repetitive protein
MSTGLGPFVSLVRNPAKVGQEFGILGQGLKEATSVSLNGTAAKFKVKSNTVVTATVLAGATTGFVTVTTPSGTLTSNVPFNVIP